MVKRIRIALLADVHGNLPALARVIEELERLQPDFVVLDGDLINAVPFSAEVIDCVRGQDRLVVRGNHEFYYLDFGTERAVPGCEDPERWGQLHWLVRHISPEQGAYLATLPDERTLYLPGAQPLRIAHGVPGKNRVGFYAEEPVERVAEALQPFAAGTLVSAHTHVQIDRHVEEPVADPLDWQTDPHTGMPHPDASIRKRWHLVNPGSVGLPLNQDPRAQFAIVEAVDDEVEAGGWRVTHHRVDYDRRPALNAYASTGMMAEGGVITQLFYWELVTAEPEIIYYYRWAYQNGYDPDLDVHGTFTAYLTATGREAYVRAR